MSATTFQPQTRAPLTGVVRSEFIKATTTRTMAISLLLTAAVALATVVGVASVERVIVASDVPDYHPVNTGGGLAFFMTAVPILLVWAAYTFFGELSNGVLRSTFIAVPQRGRVLAAKATIASVLCVCTAVVTMAAGQVVYGIVMNRPAALTYMFTAEGASTTLGLAFVMTCWSVISVSIAALTRHLALSVGIIVSMYLFLEAYLGDIPGAPWLAYLLPFTSGKAVIPAISGLELPNPTLAVVGQLTITVVLAGIAYWSTIRRDTK